MKRNVLPVASILALAIFATPALAFDRPNISVGPSIGSSGIGGDINLRFNDHFGINMSHNQFDYSTSYEETDLDYDADLNLQATSLTAEYFPTGKSFFISAGVSKPDNYLAVSSVPSDGNYTFNGNTYSSDDIDSIDGKIQLGDEVAPYIGIGFKSTNETGFGFFSEVGVYKLDPSSSLNATYSGSVDPITQAQFENDLESEREDLKDSLDKLGFFPVARLGVSYTF